jgi:hypothetical protein
VGPAEAAPPQEPSINLKDPALAALLAWLVPGLGHIYQGRTAKGLLFMILLLGTFAYGCYLGGSSQSGWGRTVYVAWNNDEKRLPYFCQIGIGIPAMPALAQAYRAKQRAPSFLWRGFMAPPVPENEDVGGLTRAERTATGRFTLNQLKYDLEANFELGELFTMIAGLLNILAIYDAWGGPVFSIEPVKKEDEDEEDSSETEAAAAPA